jgi:hypothetical protein
VYPGSTRTTLGLMSYQQSALSNQARKAES